MTTLAIWPVFVGLAGMALPGCPMPKPVPVVVPPPPPKPVVPAGDLFRLQGRAGQKGQGKVSILIENEPLNVVAKARKGSVRLMRVFTLNEEHTLTAVDPDGTQHVVGRLVEIEGKGDSPREQKDVDAVSRALAEIKVSFERSPRGEVTKLAVEGAQKPLDPGFARIMGGSIYGAGRGYLFPERNTEVGNDWKVRTEVPIPQPSGGQNNLEIDYHYEKKDGSVATISFKGKSQGESQGAQLQGTTQGEVHFDLATGDFMGQMVDTISERSESGVGSRLHVHVDWQATPVQGTVSAPAQAAPSQGAAPPPAQ